MDWQMFRSEGLAKALTDAGHEVSDRTVDRWKAGTSKPSKGHLQAIRELVGADTTKEPPPEWAGAMERRLDVLVAKAGVDPETLDEDETTRLVREALARASSLTQTDDGG